MKKIIFILAIILLVAAVGVGIYFGWKKSKEILTPPSDDQQSVIDNQQFSTSTILKPKLRIVSDQQVFDYFINQSSDVFYITSLGHIFKVNENKDELISDKNIENLIDVKADKNGARIIVKYGNSNSPKIDVFDIENKVWQLIGNGSVSAADFSPDSLKIIYVEKKNNGVSDLITKDLNLIKPKTTKIMSLSYLPFDLQWVNSDSILLISAPSAGYVGEIWQLDLKTKAIKIFANSFGLMLKWPIGGDSGLLFNSAKNQISLIDSNAKKKADIEILTLPDKCFINSTMIYCAVMQNYSDVLPKPALPDDYFKKAFYSVDKIYAIGITDNSSEIILSNEELPIVDAVNLSLSGNNLLFINRYDDKVYSLEL